MMDHYLRFAIVMVTYNRLACLKVALEKYEKQTMAPAYIVVVNNASTDGTKEYLDQWLDIKTGTYEKIVLHCTENTGGAGGFSRGVEEGLKLDCDFLFLADDDAYAEPDMLEKLEVGYHLIREKKIVAICTANINHGKYDVSHRCHIKKAFLRIKKTSIDEEYYNKDNFEVDTVSFVGIAVRKDVAAQVGLPKKEYFIWNDDVEYSLRLLKKGTIYCIPSSIMHHDVVYDKSSSWKDYYGTRNWIDMIRIHYPKRFFYCAVIGRYIKQCSIFAFLLKKRNKEFRRMCFSAIKDAVHGNLGKNNTYCPKTL